jgi:hypothetical protein
MELAKLDDLKEKMLKGKNFSVVWDYFFDHFGEDPEFIEAGQSAPEEVSSLLSTVIEQVAAEMLRQTIIVVRLLVVEIPGRSFYHGACTFNGRPGSLFYFGDVGVGMLSVTSPAPSSTVTFARFTATIAPQDATLQ